MKDVNRKLKYIIEQNKDKPKEKIDIDIDNTDLEYLEELSESLDLSVSETIEAILIDYIMGIRKKELEFEEFSKTLDIYDFYRIEEIIDELQESEKPFLICDVNKEYVLMKA